MPPVYLIHETTMPPEFLTHGPVEATTPARALEAIALYEGFASHADVCAARAGGTPCAGWPDCPRCSHIEVLEAPEGVGLEDEL